MTQTAINSAPSSVRRLTWWQAIAAGAVFSVAVNLLVFLLGNAAGASFLLVSEGAPPHQVVALDVVISSVVPLVVGTAAAVLIARWWATVLRIAQVIAGILAVATIGGPATADTDTATLVSLGVMHVISGVAAIATLEAVRRARA